MKSKTAFFLFSILVGAFLFSCANNQAEQTVAVDTDAVRTQAVQTYAANLTRTAPTSAPLPTLTAVVVSPTATELSLTPEPTATTNPCFNLMYVKDVTIEDGKQMKAGEKFTKTWQVQNIGGCAWRAGFTFQLVGGEAMRGNTVTLTESVQTGAKRDISVELVAPSDLSGKITGAWRMADLDGGFFGDTLFVVITVGDAKTPTPSE
ncbi:MAG: hypothetical protein LC099_00960 [Anaerolineales bacterium]|nr:hypothetical protein [Anaerolineales bacterium]